MSRMSSRSCPLDALALSDCVASPTWHQHTPPRATVLCTDTTACSISETGRASWGLHASKVPRSPSLPPRRLDPPRPWRADGIQRTSYTRACAMDTSTVPSTNTYKRCPLRLAQHACGPVFFGTENETTPSGPAVEPAKSPGPAGRRTRLADAPSSTRAASTMLSVGCLGLPAGENCGATLPLPHGGPTTIRTVSEPGNVMQLV